MPVAADTAARMIDAEIHIDPDPLKVYALVISHGIEAAFERWGWLPKPAIGRLAERGRATVQGGRSAVNTRRTQTPAQEREIVAAVVELGGVDYAARSHGVSATLVTKLLVEHGHSTWPRASRRMDDVIAARARMAAYVGRRA
ncbi:hypothetical protein [uncultured Methylobacterium sp.]|jgi:hypothetical protein|uniref:hypothetical protein n=1 Tax=uncultured Methylobacterium sp. TaxID=157278 RepID=UPI00261A0CA8|nr:hypothetical protein [uncultured Methylobacterium sp.]